MDLTILLVEDHDDTRTYLGLFLARLGARILLARNVFEAVEAVRTFHPNIVLSDISMPNRDGFHLLRDRGLGTDAGGGVPVIAMTAMVTPVNTDPFLARPGMEMRKNALKK